MADGAIMTLLQTKALSRRFGGVEAVNDVSFELPVGEIRAIIGPNGAGKTTFVNMISGRIPPTAGRILFKGRDITGLSNWRRVRSGIVYTFQITSIFQNLTCRENVALAAQRTLMRGVAGRLLVDHRLLRDRVAAGLARVGLAERADEVAATLPYGYQRLLEVAMGLALSPQLLIMDEPTQGLSDTEIADFCDLIRGIAREATVLLIEHNMQVVMALADRITVMTGGQILAEGTPDEIRAEAAVQQAYLGA